MSDYDRVEENEAYRCRVSEADSVTEAVVFAVNRCLERDGRETSVMEQTPLYEQVDPDSLNNLFPSHGQSDGWVSFEYEGYDVTVTSAGEVIVRIGGGTDER